MYADAYASRLTPPSLFDPQSSKHSQQHSQHSQQQQHLIMSDKYWFSAVERTLRNIRNNWTIQRLAREAQRSLAHAQIPQVNQPSSELFDPFFSSMALLLPVELNASAVTDAWVTSDLTVRQDTAVDLDTVAPGVVAHSRARSPDH